MSFLNFIFTSVAFGMTFLFGCTGEIITEKAGHLNLGIPGVMCIGGATGCLALALCRPIGIFAVPIAILAAFIGGVIMGGIYGFLTVTLKANQNVTGLAMTIFGAGATKYIMLNMTQKQMNYLYATSFFRLPIKNSDLRYWGVMFYLAIAVAIITSYVLNHTRVGLHLRSIGENPATADAVGINVTAYKYGATCIGSGIAALGGLYFIMVYMGSQEAYKTVESLGWLSVALVIFTLWKPNVSIIGSMIFGMLYLLGTKIPTLFDIKFDLSVTPLLEMLPYVVTILVLIITSIGKKRENQPPASLGLPYFREER